MDRRALIANAAKTFAGVTMIRPESVKSAAAALASGLTSDPEINTITRAARFEYEDEEDDSPHKRAEDLVKNLIRTVSDIQGMWNDHPPSPRLNALKSISPVYRHALSQREHIERAIEDRLLYQSLKDWSVAELAIKQLSRLSKSIALA